MKKRMLALATALLLALCPLFPGMAATVDEEDANRWLALLTDFVETVGQREIYTPGEERALAYLIAAFQGLGYATDGGTLLTQSFAASRYDPDGQATGRQLVNLIAVKKAQSPEARVIVVCAHYDAYHGTPGAKDNGSGIAALLLLAEKLGATEPFADTELRFVALAGEEKGEYGAHAYVDALNEADRRRVLAVFNIDLITLDLGAADVALSCNSYGGWTEDGYEEGVPDDPVPNAATRAFRHAFDEIGGYTVDDENWLFCIPRHWADGDHMPFHNAEIDACTVCFQGHLMEGGSWPRDMHTPEDALKPYDMERTGHALSVLYNAVSGLAGDHGYGQTLPGEPD